MESTSGRPAPTEFSGVYQSQGGALLVGNTIHAHSVNFNGPAQENYECLQELRASGVDPEDEKTRIQDSKCKLLAGSYSWIFDDEVFQSWDDAEESKILRITGDAGKGKTMIMFGLVNELTKMFEHKSNTRIATGFFFCQGTDARLNTATQVIKGLIYSLLQRHDELVKHLRKRHKTSGKMLFEGPNVFFSMVNVLSDILADKEINEFYFFIDALDECKDGLEDLLKTITGTVVKGGAAKVKWLVSSRNNTEIAERLTFEGADIQLTINLEQNQHVVTKYVQEYIRTKLSTLNKVKKYRPEHLKQIQATLEERAGGTFLWVDLVCKELESPKAKSWNISKILQAMPVGLEATYELMLLPLVTGSQSEDEQNQLCCQILSRFLLVQRPVNLLELAIVAELPTDDLDEIEGLVRGCGSFLSIQKDTIYFVHQSARDYLEKQGSKHLDSVVCSADKRHQAIFKACLSSFKQLSQNICNLKHPSCEPHEFMEEGEAALFEDFRHLGVEYACCNWAHHLKLAFENSSTSLSAATEAIEELLGNDYLHWVEALCLIRELSAGILQIDFAVDIFAKNEFPELHSKIDDARRFLRYNRQAIESTPLQLYSSALMFTPESSWIKQTYIHRLPEWLKALPSVDSHWDGCLQTFEADIRIRKIAFSLNGLIACTTIYSRSYNCIRVWDATTAELMHTLVQDTSATNFEGFAFSPDGEYIVAGDKSGKVYFWNLKTDISIIRESRPLPVTSVTFLTGTLVATASNRDITIDIWDFQSGKPIRTLESNDNNGAGVISMSFSPDQRTLWCGFNKEGLVRAWDLPTAQYKDLTSENSIGIPVFSPKGDLMVHDINGQPEIRIWELLTGSSKSHKEHSIFKTSGARSLPPVISADNKFIAAALWKKAVELWDLETRTLTKTIKNVPECQALAFSPDGYTLAIASDTNIRIWDTSSTGDIEPPKTERKTVFRKIFLSRDGTKAIGVPRVGQLQAWEQSVDKNPVELPVSAHDAIDVAISSDGKFIVFNAEKETFDLTVWKLDQPECTKWHVLSGHESAVTLFVLSSDDKWIVSCEDLLRMRVWSSTTGECIAEIDTQAAYHRLLAMSEDSQRIILVDRKNLVQVFDWPSTKHMRYFILGPNWDYKPSGRILATSPKDRTLACLDDCQLFTLWDIVTGKRFFKTDLKKSATIARMSGRGTPNLLSFTADGSYVSTGWETIRVPPPAPQAGYEAAAEQPVTTKVVKKSLFRKLIGREHNAPVQVSPVQKPLEHKAEVESIVLPLNFCEEWLSVGSQRLLWIPPQYRSTIFNISGDTIAVAKQSGGLYFIRLDLDLLTSARVRNTSHPERMERRRNLSKESSLPYGFKRLKI